MTIKQLVRPLFKSCSWLQLSPRPRPRPPARASPSVWRVRKMPYYVNCIVLNRTGGNVARRPWLRPDGLGVGKSAGKWGGGGRLKRLRKAGEPKRREGLLVQCGQRASCMFPTFAGLDGLLQLSQTIIPSARSSTWQIRSPAVNTAMKWKSNPKELTETCTCSLSQLRTTLSLDANTNERTTRACPTERGTGLGVLFL